MISISLLNFLGIISEIAIVMGYCWIRRLLLGLQAINRPLVGGLGWVPVWIGLSPVPCSIRFYWDKGLLQVHGWIIRQWAPYQMCSKYISHQVSGRASARPVDRSLSGQDCS